MADTQASGPAPRRLEDRCPARPPSNTLIGSAARVGKHGNRRPLESTSEILGSIFCSQAKEYLGQYGRVTNTWKAKIRSRIQLLPDLYVADHPRLTLDFLIPATTLSFRWLVQRPGTCNLEPCTTRAAV